MCPTASNLGLQGVNAACVADVHKSYIMEDNTMLVTFYNVT